MADLTCTSCGKTFPAGGVPAGANFICTGCIARLGAELKDMSDRLALLKQASRPTQPLTDAGGITVQGLVVSAITKLERELTRRRLG